MFFVVLKQSTYIPWFYKCIFLYFAENKIENDDEIVNSLKNEDSSGNTQAEPVTKEETHCKNKENTTFDVNDATKNATIVDSLNNPYYEGSLPGPIEIPIEEEYVLPEPSKIQIEDEYGLSV